MAQQFLISAPVSFNIPCIDSGIAAGAEIIENTPVFREPPCYLYNDQNTSLIYANYPRNLSFDLEEAVGDVILSSPPGTVVDFVELAEKACRIYDDYSQFYSLSDELFDSHDKDNFIQALREIGAFDGLQFTANMNSAVVLETMYEMHIASLERFMDTIMRKLALHEVPAFSSIGCIYMPDAFIADTCILVLKFKLDY